MEDSYREELLYRVYRYAFLYSPFISAYEQVNQQRIGAISAANSQIWSSIVLDINLSATNSSFALNQLSSMPLVSIASRYATRTAIRHYL